MLDSVVATVAGRTQVTIWTRLSITDRLLFSAITLYPASTRLIAVAPMDPGKSLLVERIKSGEMPPVGKKVPAGQIAVIKKWIAGDAPTLV